MHTRSTRRRPYAIRASQRRDRAAIAMGSMAALIGLFVLAVAIFLAPYTNGVADAAYVVFCIGAIGVAGLGMGLAFIIDGMSGSR